MARPVEEFMREFPRLVYCVIANMPFDITFVLLVSDIRMIALMAVIAWSCATADDVSCHAVSSLLRKLLGRISFLPPLSSQP